jgi:hypothetical protein
METMWHYVKDGTEKHGPVAEGELRSLAERGEVLPTDLVWSDGMTDWMPYASAPGLGGSTGSPAPAAAAAHPLAGAGMRPGVAGAHEVPPGLAGWLQFVGVMTLIGAVLTFLGAIASILGAFANPVPALYIGIGIFYVVAGALMWMAGKACTRGRRDLFTMHAVDEPTASFLGNMKRFFTIVGIYYLVSLAVMVLVILLLIAMLAGAISGPGLGGMGGSPF